MRPETDIYAEALQRWGLKSQLGLLAEECGELIAMINRWQRGRTGEDSVAIEAADVEIMLGQLRLIMGSQIDAAKRLKLARLEKRLEVR